MMRFLVFLENRLCARVLDIGGIGDIGGIRGIGGIGDIRDTTEIGNILGASQRSKIKS